MSGSARSVEVVPFDQAIDFYTQEIPRDPDPASYFHRGLIWVDRSEYDHALADFSEAIRLDPKFAYAFNNRGNAWFGRGDAFESSPARPRRSVRELQAHAAGGERRL